MKNALAVLLAVAAAACAGAPGQPVPDGVGLAYTVPDPNPLRYEAADTSRLGIEMGGNSIDVAILSTATVSASFENAADGVTATVEYTSLAGSFSNSMAPTITMSRADLPTPARLSLDRKGRITFETLPETSDAFRQVLGAEGAFRRLFIALPGATAQTGMTWTDTVTVSENIGEMTSTSTEIITSTLGPDTTIDGRSFRVINSRTLADTRISGSTQGMDITQTLRTTATARTLWDPARRAVYERIETGTATGSMAMPAMGVSGVPITMSSKSVVRLLTM